MLKTLGDDSQSQNLRAGHGLIPCDAIGKDSGQLRHFGLPAPILLQLSFD